MSRIIDVWVNCASEDEAARVADAAIEHRLAACANMFPPITSAYRWQGAIEREPEVALLLKTRPELFERLARLVERMHSYEVPAIIGIPVEHVNAAYEAWVIEETEAPA